MTRAVILILLVVQSLVFANGLKCIHCRLDLCTHEYCPQSQQLFNSTSNETAGYVEIEEWANIPPCPEKPEDRNTSALMQTCSTHAVSCGYFNYKIATQDLPNIVPGKESAVPVVAGGSKSYESSVIVLGCVKADYKCRTGLKNTVEILTVGLKNKTGESSNATTAAPGGVPTPGGDAKINKISNFNNASNCCKCETDLCNLKEDLNDCNVHTIPVPQHDTTAAAAMNIGLPLVISIVFALVNFV